MKGGAEMAEYSVLMSVYYKEKPAYFRSAIQSMLDQTVKTNDFVLVCDGPLTDKLEEVISWAQAMLGDMLTIVRIPQNSGLGNALNKGLTRCRNELVARMDTDDVSLPDRCERQLEAFEAHSDISIVSGIVEEFFDDVNTVTARRVLPEKDDEIRKFAKTRNPFNHPCVMFKKSAVENAGGYQDMHLLEDYYLWVRMLLNGEKGMNLSCPLIRMRAGLDMYRRRGGIKYIASQKKLFSYMREKKMISSCEYLKNIAMRFCSGIVPGKIRYLLYLVLLRK